MKEVRLWPKHIWDESAVLLGKHWGTLREPHENLMRTHWEQENNQKKVPLLLLPFTKPKRKKKKGLLTYLSRLLLIGCMKLFFKKNHFTQS
jgi:hypothetical protein